MTQLQPKKHSMASCSVTKPLDKTPLAKISNHTGNKEAIAIMANYSSQSTAGGNNP